MPTELPPNFSSGEPEEDEPIDGYVHIVAGYNFDTWRLTLVTFIFGMIVGFVISRLV